jgi:hypothetical protein
MTSFRVQPPGRSLDPGGTYSIHPLHGLGGTFIYVSRNGEMTGLYFGQTELGAAAAVVTDIVDLSTDRDDRGRTEAEAG